MKEDIMNKVSMLEFLSSLDLKRLVAGKELEAIEIPKPLRKRFVHNLIQSFKKAKQTTI